MGWGNLVAKPEGQRELSLPSPFGIAMYRLHFLSFSYLSRKVNFTTITIMA